MTTIEQNSTMIEIEGIPTHLTEIGSGPPLVLIHGAGPATCVAYSFGPVLDLLARHFRVIAADMPGYGKSGSMIKEDLPANVAAHVVALLDAIGLDRATVLGHSRGGRVAVELTFAAPERVSNLVVVGSGSSAPGGHKTESGGFTAAALAIVNFGVTGDTGLEAFKASRRGAVYDPESLSDEFLSVSYDEFIASGNLERYMAQMKKNDSLNFYHHEDVDAFTAKLQKIACPVSVVWGHEDAIAPYQKALGLIDLLDDVEFHVFAHCGHSPMVEHPEAFVALLADFVARHGQ